MLIGSLVVAATLATLTYRTMAPLSRRALHRQQGWVLLLLRLVPA